MASLVEEEMIIPLTNSFEALLDTTKAFLQDHTDESEKDFNVEPDTQDQLGKVGNMSVTNDLDEEGHEETGNSNDTETLLVNDSEDEDDEDVEPQIKVIVTAQIIQETHCEYESGSTEKSRPINIEEQGSTRMTEEVKCTDNLHKYLNRRKTEGKSGEQIKWDSTLDHLQSFASFVRKSKGKWKQTGKSDKSVKHIFEEKKESYKLNWWPSSNTINLQGKVETTEKINDTINKIISDNNKANEKRDGKHDTVNVADESFATQNCDNSNPP